MENSFITVKNMTMPASIIPILAGICQLLWTGIRWLHPQYDTLLQGDTYNSHRYLLAFVMLAIGLFTFLQSGLQRWMRPIELALGATACWLLFLIAANIGLPGANFLFFWPLCLFCWPSVYCFGNAVKTPHRQCILDSCFSALPQAYLSDTTLVAKTIVFQ